MALPRPSYTDTHAHPGKIPGNFCGEIIADIYLQSAGQVYTVCLMAKSNPCPKCGANMNMVGVAHNCVPRSAQDAPRKSGDRSNGSKKASAPQPAGTSKSIEPASPVMRGEGSGSDLEPKVLKLPGDLWGRIDDYWHREKLPSRTAGIRALLEKGLGKP